MDDKKRAQYTGQIELAQKLSSIMAHPEWGTIVDLIQDERKFHSNKALDPELRRDVTEYPNIVRALDNADAVQAILSKFDTIIRLGRKAQEAIDVIDHPERTE